MTAADTAVRCTPSIPYHTVTGYRPLELDLYVPADQTRQALVIYVHGGGWRLGTRRSASAPFMAREPNLFHALSLAGYAVAAIDYRLAGEAVFPAALTDVQAALGWASNAAAEHGVRADHLFMWGDSAGAQLAALAAFQAVPETVAGLVAWYPITDLCAIQEDADAIGGERHDDRNSRETALLGGLVAQHQDLARQASPVNSVRRDVPATFCAHGTADMASPYRQSERLIEAVRATGAEGVLYTVDGAGHMWAGASDQQLDDLFRATMQFLNSRALRS
jgi:acetyl esterase/lipase